VAQMILETEFVRLPRTEVKGGEGKKKIPFFLDTPPLFRCSSGA